MLSRGKFSSPKCLQQLCYNSSGTGYDTWFNYGSSEGTIQEISALNYTKVERKPGEFHANPVYIRKRSATAVTGETPWMRNPPINARIRLIEDIAGVMAAKCELTDPKISWSEQRQSWAQNKAFAKAAEPDFDLGQNLAELRETIEGLFNPLSALREWIRTANKLTRVSRRFRNVKMAGRPDSSSPSGWSVNPAPSMRDGLDMLTGSWLEWRYGIRPLIKTVNDLIEHINKQINAFNGKMFRKTGVYREERGSVSTLTNQQCGWVHMDVTIKDSYAIKYASKLYYTCDAPVTWQHRYGIEADQIPGMLWEVLSLSFVYDWMISVGDWLAALEYYTMRCTTKGLLTSRKLVFIREVEIPRFRVYTTEYYKPIRIPRWYMTVEELDRRIPVNPNVSYVPTLGNLALNFQQKLDSLSLIWQRLPKLKKR